MKIIRCEDCNAIIWDKQVVKLFWNFKLNNVCPCCRSYGSLRREKKRRKEVIGRYDTNK